MSIFYKIDRINKSDFHKSICLKNTVDRIENNNAHFNKITDSISGDGETKKIKNERDTKSVPFEGIKGRDSIKVAALFQNHQNEHLTSKQIACYCNISHSSAKKICMRCYLKNWINHTNNEYEFTQKIIADELKKIGGFLDQKYYNFILVVRHIQEDRKGGYPLKRD